MQTDNAQSWLELFQQQWAAQSGWEIIAVVLALAYVWLAARQSIWCWPCALVSTGIYTWIFWQVTLPFQAGIECLLPAHGCLWLVSVEQT